MENFEMRYRTFIKLAAVGAIAVLAGSVCGIKHIVDSRSNDLSTLMPHPSPIQAPAPIAPIVAPATITVATTPPTAMSTPQIRTTIDQWLTAHGDRGGKMRADNILPDAPFRATALRFQEVDAVKFSNDTRQWSQIRLDLNRDGKDDEKWLLKNGHTYKREVLGADGKSVTQTQYFDR